MKNVNIEDLRKYSKDMIEDTKTIKVGKMEIEVKQHTTILEKLDFAANIYNNSIKNDNGEHIVEGILSDMYYVTGLISRYTNIKLPKDGIEAYSLVVDTGIFDIVYNEISKVERAELDRVVERYLSDKEKEYNQINSTSMTLKNIVEALADMLPDIDGITKILSDTDGISKLIGEDK